MERAVELFLILCMVSGAVVILMACLNQMVLVHHHGCRLCGYVTSCLNQHVMPKIHVNHNRIEQQ